MSKHYQNRFLLLRFMVIRQNKWRIKKVFNFAAKKHG